jgi:hypothetical protein
VGNDPACYRVIARGCDGVIRIDRGNRRLEDYVVNRLRFIGR